MQVLSSNEFLRRRIRKERPFFYFPSFKVFFGSFVFFVVVVFFFNVTMGSWMFISQGVSCQLAVPLITRERGWDFRLMKCRK